MIDGACSVAADLSSNDGGGSNEKYDFGNFSGAVVAVSGCDGGEGLYCGERKAG